MKKKYSSALAILALSNITAQCYTITKAKDTTWNGSYTVTEALNFYEHKIYTNKEGTYFLHKDLDTWYINTDKNSPDEEVLAYSAIDSETPPLEGWKTIDGSTPPKIKTGCD